MSEDFSGEDVIARPGGSILRLFGPAVVASLTASALGFVFWVVAAHYYTQSSIGKWGPTLSLCVAIGIASSGGLYSVLVRVLPVHDRPRRLLWLSSSGAAIAAGVAGAVAGALRLSRAPLPNLVILLGVASALWSLFTMQDSILLSLRKTRVLFISNVGFGAAKLALLIVFAKTRLGIFESWIIPLFIVVPIVAWVADQGIQRQSKTSFTMKVTPQHVAAEYVASFASVLVIGGAPVAATIFGGSKFGGLVFVSWTLFTATDMVSTWLSNVIVSTAAVRNDSVERTIFHSRSAVVPVVACMIVGALIAPDVLKLYGHEYAGASTLLRLLMCTLVIRVLFGLSLAARRIRRQYWRISAAQASVAVLTIAGTSLTAAHHSLVGVGLTAMVASFFGVVVSYGKGVGSGLRGKVASSDATRDVLSAN